MAEPGNYPAQPGFRQIPFAGFSKTGYLSMIFPYTGLHIMPEDQQQELTFDDLLKKVLEHLETRWEYFSLAATEKISIAASMFAGLMVLCLFALIVIFFLSIGLAFWIGDLIDNRAGGFAIAGLFFIPLGIGTFYWIRPFVREKVIQSILEDDDTENQG